MKISVVIPAYNEEKHISLCLQSLMEQEVKPDEIIVVDNNSKDDTAKIAEAFFVRVVKESEQGIIPTRNRGFNEAKYDIIARTDADTTLPKDWIKRIKNHFEKNDIDALSGLIYYYDFLLKTTFFAKLFFSVMNIILHHQIILGPNMALKKSAWIKVKNDICLDDKQVHEDIDLAIHISKQGGKILFDNSLVIATSGRRIASNPKSFFFEYAKRLINTIKIHKSLFEESRKNYF